jgi:hypothetical protein
LTSAGFGNFFDSVFLLLLFFGKVLLLLLLLLLFWRMRKLFLDATGAFAAVVTVPDCEELTDFGRTPAPGMIVFFNNLNLF